MMDVLFYYYYLCYKNIIPDVKPHFTAVWVMGITISFFITIPAYLFFIYRFHIVLDSWFFLCVIGVIISILYLYYLKTNKWKQIIKEKPMLNNSHKLSIVFTITFTVLGFAFLVIGAILGKKILDSP
jgi:hypothetical protein